ncbi:hypothetical protein LEN26_007212 [Aphanomyces euteiches]|nr:hypothetical protein LEN26_007212 [Aphanomyces euteiches]
MVVSHLRVWKLQIMLRHALRRRFAQAASPVSRQTPHEDLLMMLKTIADATPTSLIKFTSADWLVRLTVLARHNSSRISTIASSKRQASSHIQYKTLHEHIDFMNDLRYYIRVCDATYSLSEQRFMKNSLLAQRNVTMLRSHQGGVFAPKYYLYVDHDKQAVVLVVRGTASIQDFVTDMCMIPEPFQSGYGHRGIVHAAHWLDWKLRDQMLQLAEEYPTYDVRLTGHSLGAGAAALVAHIWAPVMPRMHCLVFAPPACLTLDLAQACEPHVTSVILGDDCVPRLSGKNLINLIDKVEQFDMSAAVKFMMAEELEAKAKQTQESASVKQLREAINRVEDIKKTASEKLSSLSPSVKIEANWLDEQPFATKLKQLWEQLDKHLELPPTPRPKADKSWLNDKPFAAELKELWEQVENHLERTQQYLALEPKQLNLVGAWPFKTNEKEQMEWRQRVDFVNSMPESSDSKQLLSLWGKLDINVVAVEGLLRFVNSPERKIQLINQIEGLLQEISTARSKFSNLAPVLEPVSNRLYELLMTTKHALQQTNIEIPMTNSFKSERALPPVEKKETRSSKILEDKILSMVDGICEELRRETDSILKMGSGGEKITDGDAELNELMGSAPVYPPGTVYILDRTSDGTALALVPHVDEHFNEIIVSNDMIIDHLSSTYDEVIIEMMKILEDKKQS